MTLTIIYSEPQAQGMGIADVERLHRQDVETIDEAIGALNHLREKWRRQPEGWQPRLQAMHLE